MTTFSKLGVAAICCLAACLPPPAQGGRSQPTWQQGSSDYDENYGYEQNGYGGDRASTGDYGSGGYGSGGWALCTAKGGGYIAHGSGSTREEASAKAIQSCHTMGGGICSISECMTGEGR